MKMIDAMEIINGGTSGFMVSLEWRNGNFLRSDHFPDRRGGENLIPTEEKAWTLATEFAKKTVGKAVNIYVIKSDFVPVDGYQEKLIHNR
jgi:hypothetical protein